MGAVDTFGGEPGIEDEAQDGPAHEGDEDAGLTGHHGHAPTAAQELRLDLEAHEEHENHDPHLAHGGEIGKTLLRKEGRRGIGRDESQERGPEQDSRDHLTHDLRLMEAPEEPSDASSGEKDDGDLSQKRGEMKHVSRILLLYPECKKGDKEIGR
jgi:hypothetical protein